MIERYDFHDPSDSFQVGIPTSEDEPEEQVRERLLRFANFVRMMNPDDWKKWLVHCYEEDGTSTVLTMGSLLS